MGQVKVKTFVGLVSLLAWISILAFEKTLKVGLSLDPLYFSETSRILLLYLAIPIFFIWVTLGLFFGLISIITTYLYLTLLFDPGIYIFPAASLIMASFIGYKLNRVFENDTKNLQLAREKLDEELNLLTAQIKSEENDSLRMRGSLGKITHLKGIIEDYSLTLSEEDILNSIVRNSFELFEDANRVLLYLVDTEKQELKLVQSKKRDVHFPIKAKKGDVFDRWVLKHRMPLLVEDIHKDFRFSSNEPSLDSARDGSRGGEPVEPPVEPLDQGFNSIISVPLVSEHRILGTLRVDSKEKSKFTQSDLRFLDIIADLSSVSLQNTILYKKVEKLAIHDSLTGLYVQKYFIERLKKEMKRSLINNMDFSLLMLDLDDFKAYNDKYGHNAGDLVLKHVSSILESFANPGDIIARYGGEEFTLLLLNKDKRAARKIAEDIRKKINLTPLVLRKKKTLVTASIGVASSPKEAKTDEELMKLVDARLYKAKEKGKNKVWAG